MGIKDVGLRMRFFGVEIKVEGTLLVMKASGCNHRRKSLGKNMNTGRDESYSYRWVILRHMVWDLTKSATSPLPPLQFLSRGVTPILPTFSFLDTLFLSIRSSLLSHKFSLSSSFLKKKSFSLFPSNPISHIFLLPFKGKKSLKELSILEISCVLSPILFLKRKKKKKKKTMPLSIELNTLCNSHLNLPIIVY